MANGSVLHCRRSYCACKQTVVSAEWCKLCQICSLQFCDISWGRSPATEILQGIASLPWLDLTRHLYLYLLCGLLEHIICFLLQQATAPEGAGEDVQERDDGTGGRCPELDRW